MTATGTRHLVDPELGPLLDVFPTIELSDAALTEMRARSLPFPIDPDADGAVTLERRHVAGPASDPEVEVFIYRPVDAQAPLPCIFHIHGGGYVGGSAASMEGIHKPLARDLGCVIVSVEYRLAPETRFPGAVEDCYAALGWLFTEASALGVDPARIGVMGESAGGGLAAALALLVRDRGEYALSFQHLIYPMVDDRTPASAVTDRHPHVGEFIWTHHNNQFGWRALLGREPGSEGVSPYAAAARAESLAGLPPTYIATGALDLFLEEDIEYARRLLREGVPTEFHIFPGAFHGFDIARSPKFPARARQTSADALKRALAKPV